MKALVMGGGMSGLAAGVNLADLGYEVELVDADEIFGGRASSWKDEDGDLIDNALHCFFPYYINLLDFFKKMGVYDKLRWQKTYYWVALDGGKKAPLYYPDLPAPLHSAAAVLNMMKGYDRTPKWQLLLAALSFAGLLGKSKEDLEKMDDISWNEWVYRRGPKGAFEFLDASVRGLTFTHPHSLSAKVFANWMRKMGAGYKYATYSYADGGLGDIWVGSCVKYIESKGGKCETKKTVTDIKVENDKIVEVTINGKEKRTADVYVSAMQAYPLRKLLPAESFKNEYFQNLCYFHNAPSLSIQVWFDKDVTGNPDLWTTPNAVFTAFSDLGNALPHHFKGGSMLEIVLAPTDDLELMPDDVIFDKTLTDIKRVMPEAQTANVKKWKVIRERQGVYRAYPGMEKHRPDQRTPYSNFYLCGDWTKTHVSSGGMEAAIWNANRCAEVIAKDKLGKSITLNKEFVIDGGFLPYMKYIKPAALGVFAVAALKVLRKVF